MYMRCWQTYTLAANSFGKTHLYIARTHCMVTTVPYWEVRVQIFYRKLTQIFVGFISLWRQILAKGHSRFVSHARTRTDGWTDAHTSIPVTRFLNDHAMLWNFLIRATYQWPEYLRWVSNGGDCSNETSLCCTKLLKLQDVRNQETYL